MPTPLRVDADAMLEPRTLEDMEQDVKWLAGFFEVEEQRYANWKYVGVSF